MPRQGERTAPGGGRLGQLTQENEELKGRLAELKDAAARNDALLRKTQERELELLRAASLAQLIDRLLNGLRTAYQLDAVALTLRDPQHEVRHLLLGEGVPLESIRAMQLVDELGALAPALEELERPWLGPYRAAEHARLLPRANGLASIALIPLFRAEELEGVLAFGSIDRRRFHRELASDFLAHLGVIIGVSLENAVNRARLVRSGLTDFLTGFHNRRYLQARLAEELARAQRTQHPLVCLMIDVDHFKRINDAHGHLAGDAVLQEVARRIDAHMRMSDTGARFGGDEFSIVLPDATMEQGASVAQRVLAAVRDQPVAIGPDLSVSVTLSIGIACAAPLTGHRDLKSLAEALIAAADSALYRAKESGRNTIACSSTAIA